MNPKLLAAAIAVALSAALPSFADNPSILDQQLGPAPAPAAKPDAPKPEAAKPKPDETPVAPDLISPGAAKKLDDDELTNSLTGDKKENNAGSIPDTMRNVVTRMTTSASRLKESDTGELTQETQRRISMDLDVLIEFARKQQEASSSSQSKSSQRSTAQQRSPSQGRGNSQGGSTPANSSQLPGGGIDNPEANGRDIHEADRATWGNLPPGDRDLVVNGANEEFLAAYKDMIKRYYEALAEVGKKE